MDPSKRDELYQRFPTLYSHPSLRQYGLSCGDGWFNILVELSEKITKLDPQAKALQVKNKFGGLRFYLEFGKDSSFNTDSPHYQEIREALGNAEDRSFVTCEICGELGELDNMQVRCLNHRDSRVL